MVQPSSDVRVGIFASPSDIESLLFAGPPFLLMWVISISDPVGRIRTFRPNNREEPSELHQTR